MEQSNRLSPSAQKVQNALLQFGLPLQVVELPASTRTAVDAANAVGCTVGQIVKSLVFQRKHSGTPVLILTSGANRVDEARIAALLGEPIGKANPDFVRQLTGFAIGGIPPLGHDTSLETLVDEDLLQFSEIWAAAGTPNAVFCLTPADLLKITAGRVVQVRQAS
jgi:prolyl-tRNA editing enzyme YbaK/EbsC (Cys-tRNA(Pro) deacylase)